MSKMFDDLMEGINDAKLDAKASKKFLIRNTIEIEPLVDYKAKDIKRVRQKNGMTQSLFASFLGVSIKTVEAWEAGTNKPSGSSNRLITLLSNDDNFVKKYPFVKT